MNHPVEIIEKARQMAKEGSTIHAISLKLGVSENTISKWVRGYCRISRWPLEKRQEASHLLSCGYSKIKVSEMIGIPTATIIKWRLPTASKPVRYSSEVREKARKMVLNGVSKIQVAYKLGVSAKSVYNWTMDVSGDKIAYPKRLRHKIRYLIKKGMSKTEVAEAMGIGYTTVTRWTTDLHNNDSKVSGRYFLILRELIKNGYIITERKDIHIYKTIMKWIPNIKVIKIKNKFIYYLYGDKKQFFDFLNQRGEET